MISVNDFIPSKYSISVEQGNFQWTAPSNIALVKYWGKKENQIPANPSISFTLNNCKTITKLAFAKKDIFTALDLTATSFHSTYFLKDNLKKILNQKSRSSLNGLKSICLF